MINLKDLGKYKSQQHDETKISNPEGIDNSSGY